MPTYDYRCQKCQFRFEKFMKITDDPGMKCPKCGGAARRLFSPGGGFVLRGSGFYANDYRKPERKKKTGES